LKAKPHLLFPLREVLLDDVDGTWSAWVQMKIGGWKVAERTQPLLVRLRAPWLKSKRNQLRMLRPGPLEETLKITFGFSTEHREASQELLPPTFRVQ
jgi:hypothetical protein